MGSRQFCLKWHNHQLNLLTGFNQLLQNGSFVDVTLACDGLTIKAHKVVLSACSPYFTSIFMDNPCQHPVVILKDIHYDEMKALIDFMYKGEINILEEQIPTLLKTAEALRVKGLADVNEQPSYDLVLEKPSVILEPIKSRLSRTKRKKRVHPPDFAESDVSRLSEQSQSEPCMSTSHLVQNENQDQIDCDDNDTSEPQSVSRSLDAALSSTTVSMNDIPVIKKEKDSEDLDESVRKEEMATELIPEQIENPLAVYDDDRRNFHFIRSSRGGEFLVRRNYLFKINKTGPGGRKYYRCYKDSSNGCKARAIIFEDIINDVGEHNHEPDPVEMTQREFPAHSLNPSVQSSLTSDHSVLAENHMYVFQDGSVSHHLNDSNMQSPIFNKRKKPSNERRSKTIPSDQLHQNLNSVVDIVYNSSTVT